MLCTRLGCVNIDTGLKVISIIIYTYKPLLTVFPVEGALSDPVLVSSGTTWRHCKSL